MKRLWFTISCYRDGPQNFISGRELGQFIQKIFIGGLLCLNKAPMFPACKELTVQWDRQIFIKIIIIQFYRAGYFLHSMKGIIYSAQGKEGGVWFRDVSQKKWYQGRFCRLVGIWPANSLAVRVVVVGRLVEHLRRERAYMDPEIRNSMRSLQELWGIYYVWRPTYPKGSHKLRKDWKVRQGNY